MKKKIAMHIRDSLEQILAVAKKENFIAADSIQDAINEMNTAIDLLDEGPHIAYQAIENRTAVHNHLYRGRLIRGAA